MKRNRIIMLILIIMSGVFASFYGGAARGVFYFMLLLPVIALIYTFYVYEKFKIYQTVDSKTVMKGEKIPYKFNLSNEDYITYTNVRVSFMTGESTVDNLDFDKDYCLLPDDSIDVTTTLCCHYRGEYKAGIKTVVVKDFLHLFEISYPALSSINMRVLPRIVEIDKPVFMPVDEDMKNSEYSFSFKQEFPDIDMRKYMQGDSRKMIHWKASAKKQELFSRKYYDTHKSEAVFVIDLKKAEGEPLNQLIIEDKIIESTLAVVKYYIKIGTPVRLYYDDGAVNNILIRDKSDFDVFYNSCTDIKFFSKTPASELVSESLRNLDSRDFCLAVVHEITEEFSIACAAVTETGNDITVLYISDEADDSHIKLDSKVKLIRILLTDEISDVLSRG